VETNSGKYLKTKEGRQITTLKRAQNELGFGRIKAGRVQKAAQVAQHKRGIRWDREELKKDILSAS